jgi:hypothetical protein
MERAPLNLPPLVFARRLGGAAGDGRVNPGLMQFRRGDLLNVETQLQPGKRLLSNASEIRICAALEPFVHFRRDVFQS